MEYQKIINLLNDTPNQLSRYWAKNWVEINNNSWGKYKTNSQIKFKTRTLNSSLCDYSDAYALFERTITVLNKTVTAPAVNNDNKKVMFKNCTPFTDSISNAWKQYTMLKTLM